MLPYSPLHHLLLADVGADARDDERQRVRRADRVSSTRTRSSACAAIADLFLVHDRPIQTRTDDSVVRVARSHSSSGARAATFPAHLPLPGAGTPRPLLACGAELKNTFCLARGTRAWVSHHIGDLENYETLRSFIEGIEHFGRAVRGRARGRRPRPPPRVPVDQVRARARRRRADRRPAPPRPPGRVPGRARRDRAGHRRDLRRHRVRARRDGLGRRAAARRRARVPPRRVAAAGPRCPAARARSGSRGGWRAPGCRGDRGGRAACRASSRGRSTRAWAQVHGCSAPAPPPATTSMGRLFDAVAALAGIRAEVNYEGQAAIELEAACDPAERGAYPIAVTGAPLVIDPRETIRGGRRGRSPPAAPRARSPAGSTARSRAPPWTRASRSAAAHGTDVVVLSGGVFQSRLLLESVSERAHRRRPARARARAAAGQRRRDRLRPGCGRGGRLESDS